MIKHMTRETFQIDKGGDHVFVRELAALIDKMPNGASIADIRKSNDSSYGWTIVLDTESEVL